MSTTQELNVKIQGLKSRAKSRYRQLVLDAANGRDVDENELLAVVRDVGKSLDDFRVAVSTLQSRMEAVTWLEQADALEPAIVEANEEYQDKFKNLLALKERHRRELEAADKKRSEAYGVMRRLESQRDRLKTEAVAILQNSASRVDDSIRSLRAEISELQNAINRRAVMKIPPKAGPDGVTHPSDQERLQREHDQAMEARRQANARDEARIAELEDAINNARESQWDALAFDIV